MKIVIILLMTLSFACCAFANEVDKAMAKNAEIILEVENSESINKSTGCDKYCWQEVKIKKVIKNEGGYKLSDVIKIAYYSWEKGIPLGESIVYLEKYNPSRDDLWKLVGGKAETGVSSAYVNNHP
jgi:hypothetical protein